MEWACSCEMHTETGCISWPSQTFTLFKVFSPLSPHIDCGQMFWGGIGVPETVEHEPLVSPNGGECTVLHCSAFLHCITLQCIVILQCIITLQCGISLHYTALHCKCIKGRVLQKYYSFIGLVGHKIWWEIVETGRSDLNHFFRPQNRPLPRVQNFNPQKLKEG